MAGIVDPFGGFKEASSSLLKIRESNTADLIGAAKLQLQSQKQEAAGTLADIKERRAVRKEARDVKKFEQDITNEERATVTAVSEQVQELYATRSPQGMAMGKQLILNNKELVDKHAPGLSLLLEASDDDAFQMGEGDRLQAEAESLDRTSKAFQTKMTQAREAYQQAGKLGELALKEMTTAAPARADKKISDAAKQALKNNERLSTISGIALRAKAARGLSELAQVLGIKGKASTAAVNTLLKQLAKEARGLKDDDLATELLSLREGADAGGFVFSGGKLVPVKAGF